MLATTVQSFDHPKQQQRWLVHQHGPYVRPPAASPWLKKRSFCEMTMALRDGLARDRPQGGRLVWVKWWHNWWIMGQCEILWTKRRRIAESYQVLRSNWQRRMVLWGAGLHWKEYPCTGKGAATPTHPSIRTLTNHQSYVDQHENIGSFLTKHAYKVRLYPCGGFLKHCLFWLVSPMSEMIYSYNTHA